MLLSGVPTVAIPCDYDKEVDMVTTIGIDPHKATHTAVAINER